MAEKDVADHRCGWGLENVNTGAKLAPIARDLSSIAHATFRQSPFGLMFERLNAECSHFVLPLMANS